MATLTNQTLSITPVGEKFRIIAKVDVTFTDGEIKWIASGMIVIVKCTLFEQDPSDNEPLIAFTKRPKQSGTVVFDETVIGDILDTEPGCEEIFARFRMRIAGVPEPVQSGVVKVCVDTPQP